MSKNTFINNAVKLYERELPVIPVHPKSKAPVVKEWSKYSNELPSSQTYVQWESKFPHHNIGLVLGKQSGLIAIDVDTEDTKLISKIQKILPETQVYKRGQKGYTAFYRFNGEPSQKFILKGARAPFLELLSTGCQTVIPPSIHPQTNEPYEYHGLSTLESVDIDDLPYLPPDFIQQMNKMTGGAKENMPENKEEGRNNKLKELATAKLYSGIGIEQAAKELRLYDRNNHLVSLFSDTTEFSSENSYSNSISFVANILETINKGETPISPISKSLEQDRNTPQLDPDAPFFSGELGRVIKSISNQTEASPISILTQLITVLGNIYGKRPYIRVGGKKTYANMFTVIVGSSGKGRKGTAFNNVKDILGEQILTIDYSSRIKKSIGSGEVIPHLVKDETVTVNPKTGKEEISPPAGDKRLLIVESEFAGLLRIMSKEGNTSSPVLRDAWDSEKLENTVKTNSCVATDSHISLIGHITKYELEKTLDDNQKMNGLGNRILWIYSDRTKLLPLIGRTGRMVVEDKDFIHSIAKSISFSKKTTEMQLDSDAKLLWEKDYKERESSTLGDEILDSLSKRASTYIAKLAMIFALTECSPIIKLVHMKAAISLWAYSQETIHFIFGNSSTPKYTNKILKKLRESLKLTRTEIRDLLKKNAKKYEIERVKHYLLDTESIKVIKNGHREEWHLLSTT